MRDHNGIQGFGAEIPGFQPPFDFDSGEPGIHKNGGAAIRNVNGIPLAAAGQHAQGNAGIFVTRAALMKTPVCQHTRASAIEIFPSFL